MKRILLISLALGGLLTSCAVHTTENAQLDDAKAVEGTWQPITAEIGGQPVPDTILKSITLKLDDGKYEAMAGTVPDKGTYTMDSDSKPRSMSITSTEGVNIGKTFPAIYELNRDNSNGDTLEICYDLSGAKRPAEFKSIAGTQLYLVTYSRKKQ
jgi:uncharacterized protein (TIGR03067 family)